MLNAYADIQQRFEELGGYTYRSEMMTIFTKFGFQEDDLKRPISTFSGGQKTRLAFVKLLLSKPDVLLLDEPTNHLDIDTIEWLEGYVKRYPKAVVLVSHDRMFLDDVVDVVYEIEYGVMRRYPGNYSNYVNVKKSDLEQQKSAYIRQQKMCIRDRCFAFYFCVRQEISLFKKVKYDSLFTKLKKYAIPVSYTHLDVYKRQDIGIHAADQQSQQLYEAYRAAGNHTCEYRYHCKG